MFAQKKAMKQIMSGFEVDEEDLLAVETVLEEGELVGDGDDVVI